MTDTRRRRLGELARRMADDSIDLAVVTETDSIFYLAHLWGYLGLENKRPMILVVPKSAEPTLICPAIEVEMVREMTSVSDIRSWVDGVDGEWPALLEAVLAAHRPGVPAEVPHLAAEEVYRAAGFGASYRIGRSIGCSLVEAPELKRGERTPLRAGMVLGIDGGIIVPGRFAARIGDTVLVTETGYEELTPYPRALRTL